MTYPFNQMAPVTPQIGSFQLPMDYNPALTAMPEINGMPMQQFAMPSINGPASGGSMWDNFLSSPGQQGWGGMALGAASGLMNGYLGFQQLGIAKDTLKQNKHQFNLNFGAQQKMTNSRLEDRQAARVASNPNAYQPVSDYMKKYGI